LGFLFIFARLSRQYIHCGQFHCVEDSLLQAPYPGFDNIPLLGPGIIPKTTITVVAWAQVVTLGEIAVIPLWTISSRFW